MVTHARGHLLREVPPGYAAQFVVDASVALKWIWDETGTDAARSYARGAVTGQLGLSVPGLFWYELANALRYGRARNTQEGGGDSPNGPWNLLRAVPISTIDFQPEAFPLITELAARQGITVYDASYVFLARSLTVPLVTADERLVAACSDLPYVWRLDAV